MALLVPPPAQLPGHPARASDDRGHAGVRWAAVKLALFADHHQLHVLDANGPRGDLAAEWTVQATEDRVAAAGGIAAFGTERAEMVKVEVEVLAREPAGDAQNWDHVTSCSLTVDSGVVVVMGCTDHLPDAARVTVGPGPWRIRASHKGLARSSESIRLQLWPAPHAEPRVEKRFVAPAPKPQQRVTNPRNAKQAAKLARQGETDRALQALLTLSAKDDAAAAASAAEILAYRGRWADAAAQATKLLANPTAVYAGNVFTDMARLVRRAARETRDELLVKRAARVVPAGMARERDVVLLTDFLPPSAQPGADEESFRAAVAESAKGKRFAGKEAALAAHCFALAVAFRVDEEIVARYDPGWASFDHAVSAARVLARRNEDARAWSLIEQQRARWRPVDRAQVAPVELLVDPWLSPLMTPERCELILSTPRGPEGAA
jgi:hypothetical protein